MSEPELVDRAEALAKQLPALAEKVGIEYHNRILPRKEIRRMLEVSEELTAVTRSLDQFAGGTPHPMIG